MEGKANAAGNIGIGRLMQAHAFDLGLEEGERQLGHVLATLACSQAQRAHTTVERHTESEPPVSDQVGCRAGGRKDGKAYPSVREREDIASGEQRGLRPTVGVDSRETEGLRLGRFWCKFQKRSACEPRRPRKKGVTRLLNRA
jgi:hypothetical protein